MLVAIERTIVGKLLYSQKLYHKNRHELMIAYIACKQNEDIFSILKDMHIIVLRRFILITMKSNYITT